jgi:formate/nitrite transporter FocA (FNT family)
MSRTLSRARQALRAPEPSLDQEEVRSALDRAESGAPAAGHAVRDLFSTDEIFQRIVATADEEFVRSNRLLFFSGLAAGLSIGLSFVARAALSAASGDPSGLVGGILYPIGFLLIVLGRYQLFTENTLTPVTLVLTRIASLPQLMRVWGVVLAANVIGAALVGLVLARTGVLDDDTFRVAIEIAEHGLEVAAGPLFWKGVFAGWLVASMVWLNHAARDTVTRFFIVFAVMYLVPAADLFHCVIGACEVMFLAFQGLATLPEAAAFFGVVVAGNTVGGVLLVALLNYSQTRQQRFPHRDCDAMALTWREWMFGIGRGKEAREVASDNAPLTRDESIKGAETGSMLDQPVQRTPPGDEPEAEPERA